MRQLTIAFLLLFLKSISFAQSIHGQVIETNTNLPLIGVDVYIPDLKTGTTTDTFGAFALNKIPKSTFLLEIKYVGYSTQSILVNPAENKILTIHLSQEAGELREVVITGVSKATQIRRSPIPIVAITHEYLVTNLATNAIDAIARIPGVTAVTTGPNISKPFIRGLGYNRVLTLYDGIRQEGQQWGDEHGIEVDQYSIERVEVVKGPASLTYGSDALAGVVNLIPYQPAPEGQMRGDFTAEYQTNNRLIGSSMMVSGTKKGISWMARLTHKQATNYQNKFDGRVFGTAFNETDGSGSISINRNWGYSKVNFSVYDALQEIPDGSRDSLSRKFTRQITEADTHREIVSDTDLNSYKIEKIHQHVQHFRLYTNNSFTLNNAGIIDVNLGFQHSTRQEFSHPVLFETPGLFLQLSTGTYDVKYHLPEFNDWNLTFGINGLYQQNKVTNGTEFVIPSFQQFDFAPFLLLRRSFGKLDLVGGLRYDTRTFSNEQLYSKPNAVTGLEMPVSGKDTVGASKLFSNYHTSFQGVSGSIGATYNLNSGFSIKANVSRGFRAPNIAEISANGVHPGTNIYQIGNLNFKPEFSLQPDIGVSYVSKYVAMSFDIFYNYIQNYIYNQKLIAKNGADSIIVAGNQTFQYQAAAAQLYGGEVNLDVHPFNSLHFENGFSMVYGDFLGVRGQSLMNSEKYLPFMPPFHGFSQIKYNFDTPSAHLTKSFVNFEVSYFAAQNRVYSAFNTETATSGYTLLSAGLGTNIMNKAGKTKLSLYILGSNLLNTAYQDHLSRLKYFEPYPENTTGRSGIYNMGRNISFKLIYPIDVKI